jgi:hypothetical protein
MLGWVFRVLAIVAILENPPGGAEAFTERESFSIAQNV